MADYEILNQSQIDDLINSVSAIKSDLSKPLINKSTFINKNSENINKFSFLIPFLKKPISLTDLYKEDSEYYIAVEDLKNCYINIKDLKFKK